MPYYTTDKEGNIISSSATPSLSLPSPQFQIHYTDEDIVYGYDGKLYFKSQLPITPPTLQEQQTMFTTVIQQRLDAFAQTRGYDNIFTACTYATSKDPQFKLEGQYAVDARDLTWRKAYDILADVLSGQRPFPTISEVLAELPTLVWP
jgi:hypothetical protein